MGIYGAMTTAVTGLRAQSYALENISGNIANSQTTAFKRTDTSFVDYVVENSPKRQKSGIVSAFSRQTQDVQGDILASQTSTSMAINGKGYFTVERMAAYVDRQRIFNGEDLYTRRGDFQIDKLGYLVNGGGYYLKGLPIDPISNNVSADVPEVLKIPNDFLAAKETTAVTIRANLPTDPRTNHFNDTSTLDTPGDRLLNGAVNDPDTDLAAVALAVASDPAQGITQTAAEEEVFLASTIAGGAISVFNQNGTQMNVQMRWGKVAEYDASAGVWDPATNADRWRLYYKVDNERYVQIPAGGHATGDFVFGPDGKISDTVPTGAAISPLEATFGAGNKAEVVMDTNGTPATQPLIVGNERIDGLTISIGEQLTQFADSSGAFQATELDQNGYPAGELLDVEITDLNRIQANYSNGVSRDVAEIPLVTFNSANNLRQLDGGGLAKTDQSGNPIQGAESTIVGASLEASNTDIADEFSKLIITQQAYSANTRIVSTSDEMMQETLNMKR